MSSLERSVLVVERLPARYVLGSDIRTCLPFGRSWRKLGARVSLNSSANWSVARFARRRYVAHRASLARGCEIHGPGSPFSR